MSKRRAVLRALAAGLGWAVGPLRAQQASARRVAILWGAAPGEYLERVRRALAAHGFVEGRTLSVEIAHPALDGSDVVPLVEAALRRSPELVVAQGPVVPPVHQAVSQRVPMVVAFSGDLIAAGLAESLRAPGRRLTGVSFLVLELVGKRLEMLIEVVPKAKRIGVLYNSRHYGYRAELGETERVARVRGLATLTFDVRSPADFSAAIAAMARAKLDGLVVFPDGSMVRMADEIAAFGLRERVPVVAGWESFTRAGVLASYGPDLDDAYDRVGAQAARVLQGADASRLPIELPTRICTSINKRTAQALNLVLPPALAARADVVV